MAARPESPFEGTITTWNADRGFGFITPKIPGPEIFVHIRAFEWGSAAPHLGQKLNYDIGLNTDGKRRAEHVRPLESGGRNGRLPWAKDSASYLAIPAFIALSIVVGVLWGPPLWVGVLYIAASVVCFIGYWVDKAAAVAGRWRVPESTLLIPGLLGGWPGAILGQQIFRHKTKKAGFRAAFWTNVILNVILFVLLSSPPARALIENTFDYWVQQ
jgi:uncharacterized membrane protein YsdA (DUF1294 family)/cold shock CspA family protein